MNKFEAFNIKSIPRTLNFEADMLANVASNLCPSDDFSHNKFFVELIYRLWILDNITNWRVFEDDEQIINFLFNLFTGCRSPTTLTIGECSKTMNKL